jgi:hypothetical protein
MTKKEVNMKASTLNKSSWLFAALFAAFACLAYPQKSLAEDTEVTCKSPEVVLWATGFNGFGSSNAQVTVICTGGSSVPGIRGFAYRISDNPTFASQIATVVGLYELAHPGAPITLYSDLSNLTGNDWGCGSANCRILDQLWP